MIEVDQILRHASPLALVGVEDASLHNALCRKPDLPSQIIAILHRYVHALTRYHEFESALYTKDGRSSSICGMSEG